MSYYLRAFILFFLSTTALFGEITQYDCMKVAKIDVVAENLPSGVSFNPQSVRAKLQTKTGNLFSQNEFDADLKSLADEYDRVETNFEPINDELYITLRLTLKPKIHSITFTGNDKLASKKLIKELDIDVGSLFERDKFIAALNKVKVLYVKKGYFETELKFALNEIPGTNEVDIVITVAEGRAGRIKGIEFEGFTSREEKDLLELLVTKKYNLFLSWYTGRGTYHPEMMEHDRMAIINFLQDEGYAEAEVTITLKDCPGEKRVIVVISANKGVLYQFGSLNLSGNCIFTKEAILEEVEFCEGNLYSPEAIRQTQTNLRDLYGACGYIDAGIDLQLHLRQNAPIYDISIVINEGNQYNVGMVRVFGNRSTHTPVILHECLLTPGETFDLRKVEGTETRLTNTGYFETANVYAVRSPDADCDNLRDVYIEVEEADTGNLGIFFGFSSLENIFGGVDITEANFNILGLASMVPHGPRMLRGAGEYLHLKANLGSRETAYLLQWTKPYFLDTPWIVGFDLEKTDNRLLSRGYTIKTYGGNVHGTYILNDYMKYGLAYRALHTRVSVRDDKNIELNEEGRIQGFISAVAANFIYDSTDHPRRPTCGFRSRLGVEVAGVGGNFDFVKYNYLNTYYYPLMRHGVLKFRGDVQFIQTYGKTHPHEVPLSERLFLGGETSIRGYRNFIVGPLFGNNEPRGGLSAYLLSEEYQHTLLDLPRVDAFVFVDAGYVSFKQFTVGRPVASVGAGLRMEVMKNMPMTFGLGYPIHPYRKQNGQKVDTTQRFFFAMGGTF